MTKPTSEIDEFTLVAHNIACAASIVAANSNDELTEKKLEKIILDVSQAYTQTLQMLSDKTSIVKPSTIRKIAETLRRDVP